MKFFFNSKFLPWLAWKFVRGFVDYAMSIQKNHSILPLDNLWIFRSKYLNIQITFRYGEGSWILICYLEENINFNTAYNGVVQDSYLTSYLRYLINLRDLISERSDIWSIWYLIYLTSDISEISDLRDMWNLESGLRDFLYYLQAPGRKRFGIPST